MTEGDDMHHASSSSPPSASSSSSLQAKKQARDAKRKKLEAMFDQHKQHEQQQWHDANTNADPTKVEDTSSTTVGTVSPTSMGSTSTGEVEVMTPLSYLKGSYQHPSVVGTADGGDIEQGEQSGKSEKEKSSNKNASKTYHHQYGGVTITNNDDDDLPANLSMRDEVQSLIHNDDNDDTDPSATTLPSSVQMMDKLESNPQRFAGALLLFFFMIWWL